MAIYTSWDTSTGKETLRSFVRETFDTTDRAAVIHSERLYKMLTTDVAFERDHRFAMVGRGGSVVEGGKIPMLEPVYGQTKDYNIVEYGQGFRISWKNKRFNKVDLMGRLTKSSTTAQKELKDVELAKLWNSPTATYTGFDGYYLGSVTHTFLPAVTGTYYINLGTAAPSVAALEAAVLYFRQMKDDKGYVVPVDIKGALLYYAPALEFTMQELLRSTGKPWEMSNTINTMNNMFESYCYDRLTATTAWGICNTKHDQYDIKCYTSDQLDVITRDAPDESLDTMVLFHQAFSSGFGDARQVYIGCV